MNKFALSILTAGFCWGFMGFFTRHLAALGIDANGAILVRCTVAAACFGLLILFRDPRALLVKPHDIWCFLGSGILSLLFFTYCYFNAIAMMDLSTAAILLYTAPTFVLLLSVPLFGERITRKSLLAVALAFAGCCLVSGIAGGVRITPKGLLYGLGSGFGYALYTIFSRFALQRGYSSSTINFYSCLLTALGAVLLFGGPAPLGLMFTSPAIGLWSLAIGVFSCFIPYMLYTYGLTGMENSRASVLASVEPVAASLVGIFIFGESMSLALFLGVVLVLSAVVLLTLK